MSLAVAVGLVYHGSAFLSTLEKTYDIYVHIFFASHYAESWFDPWVYKWYTGFTLVSYPPLVHQLIALISFLSGNIKFAAYILAFGIVVLYITGAYRFSKLICANPESAAYSSLIAVFLPSVVEAFHVFGQIPMMMGISWLLHALPEIYQWVRFGKIRHFLSGISIISVAVCSHHVTPIFGMVFFVVPLMATAVMDGARVACGSYRMITIKLFLIFVKKYFFRIALFGGSTGVVLITAILPYWIYSHSDPISQVPIPHGSRDSFIEVFSSGLVFFIIPWGFLFLLVPYYLYRYFSKRNIFLGLSFAMLMVLGTGGTTPVPKLLLGSNAFNILTLERFTFWATIYAMPLAGEFLWRFTNGDFYRMTMARRGRGVHSTYVTIFIICIFFSAGFTTNLSFFRQLQPKPVNLKPLLNFLKSDKHYKWRFLTLGFGDQMAWLSTNTQALTIDGNYHSARRVPELTTRAIERLENSKYRGIEGVITLQQFLTSPETFYLKYIFSNDKFYDPILYFSGWHRVKRLDNGIMVWERSDVSSLPAILPKKDIPMYQKIHWGVVPLGCLVMAFIFNVQIHWARHVLKQKRDSDFSNPEIIRNVIDPRLYYLIKYWVLLVILFAVGLLIKLYHWNFKQRTHLSVVTAYYNALDFKYFDEAFSYLIPEKGLTEDQFLLERSVTDGLLDSYGKIDSIGNSVLEKTDNYAKIETTLKWITPLKDYHTREINEVSKIGNKWYVKAKPFNNYIPTDQFSDIPTNMFLNQGRRKVSVKETFHEDVLDRPLVQVLEAKLVKKDSTYHVVGLIQNLDTRPTDLTIKASLLDHDTLELTSYYEQMDVVHKIVAKEVTPFRIDFVGVDWRLRPDSLKSEPYGFSLDVLSTVVTKDVYKKVMVDQMQVHDSLVSGYLYNYGEYSSTITQIVVAYYNEYEDLIWVDSQIVDKGVFPKKKGPVLFTMAATNDISVVFESGTAVKVNGLDNDMILRKNQSEDIAGKPALLATNDGFINFHLNNYLNNPAPF